MFNPDYGGVRLLDYGYVSAVGMSVPWTVFILGLHAAWSISVPIALVESLDRTVRKPRAAAPAQAHAPWLGRIGLTVAAVLFALGMLGTSLAQQTSQDASNANASVAQLAATAVGVLILVAFGVWLGRWRRPRGDEHCPPPSDTRVCPRPSSALAPRPCGAWNGFPVDPLQGGSSALIDTGSNVLFAAACIALVALGLLRLGRLPTSKPLA